MNIVGQQIDRGRILRRAAWIVGIVGFLIFLYVTALPGAFPTGRDGSSGLAGTYTMNGVDHLGTEYSGIVVVSELDRAAEPIELGSSVVYEVEWIVTGAIQQGSGSLDGSNFVVDWVSSSAASSAAGRAVYAVADDGTLRGQRFVDGVDQPGTEVLFPEP